MGFSSIKASITYIALATLALCSADYACVCNYKDFITVYAEASTSSVPLGNMSNWECKEIANKQVAHQWVPLAFQHQVGYVAKDSKVLLQMCSGAPPSSDMMTTAVPTTTTTVTRTPGNMVSATSVHPTTLQITNAPPTNAPSTNVPPTNAPLTKAPSTTVSSTTTFVPSASTQNVNTISVAAATTKVPVPASTGGHSSAGNTTLVTDGHIERCPPQLLSARSTYHSVVGQFGNKCYALGLQDVMSWQDAEGICASSKGHLINIENADEQAFVEGFVQNHTPNKAIWLGLHAGPFGASFMWTSGVPFLYSNWIPTHRRLVPSRRGMFSNCVKMYPQQNGYWDHANCGWLGEKHSVMCQYSINSIWTIFG